MGKNFFASTFDTKAGKRTVWVQVKQMIAPGENPASGFPENQDIVYELWESKPSEKAVAPVWKLTTKRPDGPTWRAIGARVIYDTKTDAYYLFLCHIANLDNFYIFKVTRDKPPISLSPSLISDSPSFKAKCRLSVMSWTFLKEADSFSLFEKQADSFSVTLEYFVSSAKPDRFVIPLSAIP